MMKATLSAAILSLVTFTSANAAAPQALSSHSVPVLAQDLSSTLLTKVQHRRDRDHHGDNYRGRNHRGHDRRRYRPGSRHYKAPRHWRRHTHRPHDWHRRGCIIVGPVWFCP